jgi:hypothetical protein
VPTIHDRQQKPSLDAPAPVLVNDETSEQMRLSRVRYEGYGDMERFISAVTGATPMQLVHAEREGIAGQFIKDAADSMGISAVRLFAILGGPKTLVSKKITEGQSIRGTAGLAALGLAKLLGIAKEIVGHSTGRNAENVDSAKWLGQWLDRSQPSLGGCRPADLMDTYAGVDLVARLLGAIKGRAFQ